MPNWDSAAADDLWREACGKEGWLRPTETLCEDIRRMSDARLLKFHSAASQSLIEHARKQLSLPQLAISGASPDAVEFNLPHVLPRALWDLAVDTSRRAAEDLFVEGEEPIWEDGQTYRLGPRSSAILLSQGTNGQRSQMVLREAQ